MSQFAPGTRIGPYEIVAQIGVGGMGEVYRASDTRLKRLVALKVLPAAVTSDPDRLARFQREAEVLASLNHPNIAALYGFEDDGTSKALVMELVEGPTLAERIEQGPIPIAEALSIAKLIAQALAAAHDQGIIHRDLKPANIKIRPDGEVKVLDFGLAKAVDPISSSGSASLSPTITSPAQMTAAGMILGTAAYMSPEQAAGRTVDRRTDLWAFGVVLFEMLSGGRLFDGESVSHVIAAVLKDEPDWAALPTDLPASVLRLLKRCLDKDRRRRLSDAGTAALECEEAVASPSDSVVNATTPNLSMSRWAMAASFVAGMVITAAIGWARWPAPAPAPESSRFAIDVPPERQFTRAGRHVLALSPDGMQLVYVANRRLYLHSFRTLDSHEIAGTENLDPSEPTFSPDGTWIAFWSEDALRKIPVGGGSVVKIADAGNPLGMSWSGDQIVLGQSGSVLQVRADGGATKTLLTLDQGDGDWIQSPQLIDDGRAVLFTLRTNQDDWNSADIVVHDLAAGRRSTLVKGGTDAHLLPGGLLMYARDNTAFAVAFNERSRATSGETLALERDVMPSVGGFSGAVQSAWSASGAFAYAADSTASESTLAWMTRQGKTEPTPLPPSRHFQGPHSIALSPDGKRVATRLIGRSRTQTDIWIGDIARGTYARLTSTGYGTDPVWTPDGTRVCYRTNPFELHCQVADGSAPSTKLLALNNLSTITSISRDGGWLFLNVNGHGALDLWMVANRPPFDAKPLFDSPASEADGSVSPDGKWIAYASDESGREQVFVRPFPNVRDGRWQVSPNGGTAPRWSKDGRELDFLATQSNGAALRLELSAVAVTAGTSFSFGSPVTIGTLFTGARGYDVAPDGRFLITQPSSATGTTQPRIVVVRNWLDEVKRRVRH